MTKQETDQESEGTMSRRAFLRWSAVLGGALVGAGAIPAAEGARKLAGYKAPVWNPELKIYTDDKIGLTFDEVAQLAQRFDKLYDAIPKQEVEWSDHVLQGLALELIPQYEYEGFTPRAEWPGEIQFVIYPRGQEANHVLGQSDCETFAVINGRLALPLSMFSDDEGPHTLAHELAHVAQTGAVCQYGPKDQIEASAQIASLEIEAGLALQTGNPLWLKSTVGELRNMAMGSAYALALQDKDFDKYHELRSQLSPGALSEGRFQKALRRWKDDPKELKRLLETYDLKPFNRIVYALMYNDAVIDDLAFPPIVANRPYGGSYIQWEIPRRERKLDDLAYLVAHGEELVADLKNGNN